MGQRRPTLLQGAGNCGQDGTLALAHLLRLCPLHYLAFVVATEAETLHRQGHRMGQKAQLPPTLSPAPSPPSHPVQFHSAPMVPLPFTPSCLPPHNSSGPPTSLLANLWTHLTFPIPQHISPCMPVNASPSIPHKICAGIPLHPVILQPPPLCLHRAGERPGSSHHLSILPSPLPPEVPCGGRVASLGDSPHSWQQVLEGEKASQLSRCSACRCKAAPSCTSGPPSPLQGGTGWAGCPCALVPVLQPLRAP